MLKVNDSIRNAYKQKTTQRKSYIKVGDNSFFIQNLDVSADAYDEGNVIGNAIAKIAKFDIETEYVKGLDEFELFDGIWTNNQYEYVSLGTFKLFEEQGTDEFFSSITSYDKLVLFNKPYDNTNVSFPISLYDFLKEICSQANVELETKRIANGDKILFQNLFVEGETLKQILKAICQISGNFAKIKNDKLVLGLYDYDSYIATGNEIVLEDVVEEKTKNKQYGYTKQDGTPTPDAPVEIEVGRGKNLLDIGTISFTNNKKYEGLNIPAGTYTFSAKITSNDTDSDKSRVYFYSNGTSAGFINLSRNTRSSATITLTSDVDQISLYASYDNAHSTNDVATYEDIQLEKGSKATSYLPYNTIESKSTGKNLLNVPSKYFLDQWAFNVPLTLSVGTYILSAESFDSTSTRPKLFNLIFEDGTKNGVYISSTNLSTVFTISKNVKSVDIYASDSYNNSVGFKTTFHNVMIRKSDIENDTYEPYKESSIQYNLGDNFLADKDYIQDGVLNKNVRKYVFTGEETFATSGSSYTFKKSYLTNPDLPVYETTNYECSHFTKSGSSADEIGLMYIGNNNLNFNYDNLVGGVDAFKTYLAEQYANGTPMEFYYLTTDTEQIQLETTGELRTFEPNTIITNDLNSEMEVEYGKYIEINKDELYQPEYKRTTWKLNKVVLGMKDVEGEFVSKQDDQDVEINGIHQLVINDNPFVYTQQLREEYISELFERIKGFGYVAFESGFEGIPYYELGDLIKIEDKKSIILRYNLQSPKGLESTFSAPSIIDSVVEYTQTPNVLEQKMRSTELRVDKAEGNIIGITKQTTEIRDNLNKNYYTIEQANTLIQNAETGVTNTFSEAGGNNVFRNTGLWFANSGEDAETNPYEFWDGKANEGDNDKATNYRSILLGKGSFIQDAEVPNGNYSISFYYQLLNENAIASVVINDKEYLLNSTSIKQFYTGEQNIETGEYIVDPVVVSNNHIKIEFKCDALDGVEVYDLMCNKGSVKLAYSQNQNETTTSTVNISKGITITSSADENTKFKADYDGIRVLDKNNSVKTKFTDKGTETDELVVRKKATIVGLLHQEVDDQTWVTKI